jgi:hypothetical protein
MSKVTRLYDLPPKYRWLKWSCLKFDSKTNMDNFNCLCGKKYVTNNCLSPLKLWVRSSLIRVYSILHYMIKLLKENNSFYLSPIWGRSYKRVTSDMTVLISSTWGRSYKCITSDMTILISGNWVRSYQRVTSDMTVLISGT